MIQDFTIFQELVVVLHGHYIGVVQYGHYIEVVQYSHYMKLYGGTVVGSF